MKSNLFLYILGFLALSVVLSQISDIFETANLSKVSYTEGEIYGFTLVGVNRDRYILTGDKMTELSKKIIIDGFNLKYQKNGENILIRSKSGIYNKDKNVLDLLNNVEILSKNMKLETEKLKILVKERRAYNTERVKLISGQMETDGENVFIDMSIEKLKLENVRTIYWGS